MPRFYSGRIQTHPSWVPSSTLHLVHVWGKIRSHVLLSAIRNNSVPKPTSAKSVAKGQATIELVPLKSYSCSRLASHTAVYLCCYQFALASYKESASPLPLIPEGSEKYLLGYELRRTSYSLRLLPSGLDYLKMQVSWWNGHVLISTRSKWCLLVVYRLPGHVKIHLREKETNRNRKIHGKNV